MPQASEMHVRESETTRDRKLKLAQQWAENLRALIAQITAAPSSVTVNASLLDNAAVAFELDAAQADYGRLLGKGHTTFTAIVTLTYAWAGRHGVKAIVRVLDRQPPATDQGRFSDYHHRR